MKRINFSFQLLISLKGFPDGSVIKKPPANAGNDRDTGSIPGSAKSPGEGNGNPLQYSCLENPMERRAWQAAVHGAAKSWTQLNDFTFFLEALKVEKWGQGFLAASRSPE